MGKAELKQNPVMYVCLVESARPGTFSVEEMSISGFPLLHVVTRSVHCSQATQPCQALLWVLEMQRLDSGR